MQSMGKKGYTVSIPAGVTWGTLTALMITFLGAVIVAAMIEKEILKEAVIGYGSMTILLCASFVGSMVAWSKVKRKRALVCMSAGVTYFILLLCITALFFGGQYRAVGVTMGLILAGSGTALLLGLRQGKTGKKMRRRNNH